MDQIEATIKPNTPNSEIGLKDIITVLLINKFIIFLIAFIVSTLGLMYSLSLPNIYKSQALLVANEINTQQSSLLQSYNKLSNIAGLSRISNSSDSNASKAIVKLSSLSFFEKHILPNIFLPNLMAVQSWDSSENKIIYDKDVYNFSSSKWVKDYPSSRKMPSPQESYINFKNNHLKIGENNKTGFITISIEHQSPYIAKEWVDLIVNEINAFYRDKDKVEAKIAVDYLNEQMQSVRFAEIKQLIANLIQAETQKLTLIEANEYYVYEYIDPPAVMEKKSKPARALICIFSSLVGGIIALIFVLLRHYAFNHNKNI